MTTAEKCTGPRGAGRGEDALSPGAFGGSAALPTPFQPSEMTPGFWPLEH